MTAKHTKPKIELRSVKHSDFASEETYCFEATVYVDGKRFCVASNDGHGGCNNYAPADRTSRADLYHAVKALDERIGATCPPIVMTKAKHGIDTTMTPDLETVIGDLVTRWLYARDLKNRMRRKWVYQPEPDGDLYEYRRETGQKAAAILDVIRKRHPGARLLNVMPIDEAVEVWQKMANA